jgi:hypothetical protein
LDAQGEVAHRYGSKGNVSVDPEVVLKLMEQIQDHHYMRKSGTFSVPLWFKDGGQSKPSKHLGGANRSVHTHFESIE